MGENKRDDTKAEAASANVVPLWPASIRDDLPTGYLQQVAVEQAAAARDPQPELHLRGDKDARYERVAQALAAAQLSGLHKIGFITEPKAP